jgi:hypothetical protein
MSLKDMETELYNKLIVLRDVYHCEGIKSEFENEGSDYRDLILLRYLTAKAGLKLYIKIGGVEAFTDLKMAIHLTADGVVIPMVESPFALIKSQNMIEDLFQTDYKGFDVFINIESKSAVEKLDDIFSIITPVLKGVTIGRSDLSYSYDMRGKQDCAFTNSIVEEIVDKAHVYGINKVTVGGGISKNTFENRYLIDNIIPKLACIETRNVIFSAESIHNPKALMAALDFEREYLNYKLAKNSMFIKMDENRFDTLMARG